MLVPPRVLVAIAITLAAPLAGCTQNGPQDAPGSSPSPALPVTITAVAGTGPAPSWSAPILIDETRAGGEPVIAITPEGTILVASHPGYTHYHPDPTAVPPTGSELIVPTQGQSYMWRSTDAGTSFQVVTLLPVENPPNAGPRGSGQGVSDPDFAIDSDGRIYFTDLEALASASVSWSDDDGETWLEGNDVASGGVVDRNWLATNGTTVYFRGNGINDVRRSDDGGLTWTDTGAQECGGDIVANPLNGHLFVGCADGFTVSRDEGATWERRSVEIEASGPIEAEPAIDAAGIVYRALDPDRTDVVLAYTVDEGETWASYPLKPFFPELAEGTLLWPWASAGSAGRVSVTFYGSPTATAYEAPDAEWFVYNAIILDATGAAPDVYASRLTPEPLHVGPMCQGGTGCQATTAVDDGSDRRLGDFFETTIDHDGYVHVVYSDTHTKPSDTVSHVGYVRLTGGPSLVVGAVPAGFPTQG